MAAARPVLILLAMSLAGHVRVPAFQNEQNSARGSIAGRITIEGTPAPGLRVILAAEEQSNQKLIAKSVTDQDGKFLLSQIPSGRYHLKAFAPAHVKRTGLTEIALADGEDVSGVEIDLVRGGVITGRVTERDGRPAVNCTMQLYVVDPARGIERDYRSSSRWIHTDDRGVYRVYGLAAGRYLVAAGIDIEHTSGLNARQYQPLTYSPGVRDPAQAKVIEVAPGGEITGVDLVMGDPKSLYEVTGSIVEAETGKPVPNAGVGYGFVRETRHNGGIERTSSYSQADISDAAGSFAIGGLGPGQFFVRAEIEGSNRYSDPVDFEIKDRDIHGLIVKLHKGATISGAVYIEGAGPLEASKILPKLHLWAIAADPGQNASRKTRTPLASFAPDGTFRWTGLRPGATRLRLEGEEGFEGFQMALIEHPQIQLISRQSSEPEGLVEIRPGEQISDVRIFVSRLTGGIRGTVSVKNGKLPLGTMIRMRLWRPTETPGEYLGSQVEVDANGRFEITGLRPGEYKIEVTPEIPSDNVLRRRWLDSSKTVVVVTDKVEEIKLIVDLAERRR